MLYFIVVKYVDKKNGGSRIVNTEYKAGFTTYSNFNSG